jgi:tripartite ATP-independent transporter DctP family solute receptor
MLLVFITLSVSVVGAAENQIVIKLAHSDSADNSLGGTQNGALAFKSLVESRSNGRIKVEVYPNAQLGSPREAFQSVKIGSVQMTWDGSSNWTEFCPSLMVFSMPYIFPNTTVAFNILNGGQFGKELSNQMIKDSGVRILAYSTNGWRCFTNSKHPVHTPADLKGMKIRTQGDPAMMKIAQSLGGNPTPIDFNELYTSLQQGVCEGEENPTSMIQVARLYEVQKYLTLDEHILGINPFVINEKFYQSLPENLRYIIWDSANTAANVYNGLVQYGATQDLTDLAKKGMNIYVPTAAERQLFVKGAQGPVKDYVISKIGSTWPNKLLNAIANETARYNAKGK